MLGRKQEQPKLERATGFELRLFDRNGKQLDVVGMFAFSNESLTRDEEILVSAAITLAHMLRFHYGNRAERKYFMPHLRDFRRKLDDFIYWSTGGKKHE